MINYWQEQSGKLAKRERKSVDADANLWVDARMTTLDDLRLLEETYGVRREHLLDLLDPDELSRIEKEDEYLLIIMRAPLAALNEEVAYSSLPLGIIIFPKMIITICRHECDALDEIAAINAYTKPITLTDFPAMVIKILSRLDSAFLRYLKEINRASIAIQGELTRSVQNDELIKLLNLEKSLVFFTTSLRSNHLLINKLAKTRHLFLDEDDREWLEDVEIDNRQAIEMADTYSDILSGMMDAFASIISNNMNIVMKRLTVISLVLMVPTLIASFFGMNVPLPFAESGWLGASVIAASCAVLSGIAYLLLAHGEQVAFLKYLIRRKENDT